MSQPSLEATRLLAAEAHANTGQTYGGRPYVEHLDEVACVLRGVGLHNGDFLKVAYLHDMVEDTHWTSGMLLKMEFSADIVAAVEFCTDAEGHNRKTRKANTHKRIRVALDELLMKGSTLMGVIVKWADRIANLRASTRNDSKGLLKMYRKEAATFRAAYLPDFGSQSELFDRMLAEYDNLVSE